MGLPIPCGGALVATVTMIPQLLPGWLFVGFVAFVGFLMVSKVKYPDFKGHGEKIKPAPVVVTLMIVMAMVFHFPASWLFAPFFTFMLFGLINSLFAISK